MNRFWQTISSLAAVVVVFTCLSWTYLYLNHIPFANENGVFPSLAVQIPSIWSLIEPTSAVSWVAPVVVLVLQVWLTGGFYGTLARINMRQSASASTFIVDSFRSFGRLFLWNFFWDAVYVLIAVITHFSHPTGVFAALVVLVARFVCLFGDIALVCEQQTTIRLAIRLALTSLTNGVVQMVPFGVLIAILTDASMTLCGRLSMQEVLVVAVIYGIIMTWILHMVIARYLYFSKWTSRPDASTLAS